VIKNGTGVYTVYENLNPSLINLLDLVNGNSSLMGELDIEPGDYSQLRIVVGTNSTIKFFNDAVQYSLKTPSGTTSGIKIKGKGNTPLFTVAAGDEVDLIFDFDAALSVKTNASKDKYKLDPVIKEIRFQGQTTSSNNFVLDK